MRVARVIVEEVAALLAALSVLYLSVRFAAGNPLAGLGAEGTVTGIAAHELSRLLGLDQGPLEGLASFLSRLFMGRLGPSLVYGIESLQLASSRLAYTLAPVALGVTVGYALYTLLYTLAGDAAVAAARPLAYTPGFILALPAYLSSYMLGFPDPLPSVDAVKALLYTLLAAVIVASRLLHVHRCDGTVRLRYSAIGAGVRLERLREVRVNASHTLLYAGVLAARLIERSLFIEPLLGYVGLGYLTLRAIAEGDVPLALASLSLETMASASILAAVEIVAQRIDPRLALA